MTNSTTPGYPGSTDASLGGSSTTGMTGTSDASSASGAREEASRLASEAGEAGRRVASTAKDETRAVGSEARRQAKRLAEQVGGEVRQQAAHQQSRAAGGLRTIGDEFSDMANGQGSGSGLAATVAREAGNRVGAAAQWLDERDPQALLEETKRFARRRPGMFLAIAVGAGVVVGRLVRSLAQPSDDGGSSSSGMGAGTGYGAGAGTGVGYGAAGTAPAGETAVLGGAATGTGAGGAAADPLAGGQWAEGGTTTSRGGI